MTATPITTATTTATNTATSTGRRLPGADAHTDLLPDVGVHTDVLPDVAAHGDPDTATPASDRPLHRPAAVLAELRDALWQSAERDPDELGSQTSRGGTLLALVARARDAARSLGASAGVPLTDGPGVLVLRDAASTAALLDAALDPVLLRRMG